MSDTLRCSKCQRVLPVDDFQKDKKDLLQMQQGIRGSLDSNLKLLKENHIKEQLQVQLE